MEIAAATENTKRSRKSVKRAKTGCITCKIRRVKCDEGKPTCHRCQKFGVKCDGYARLRKDPPIVKSTRKVLLPKSSIKILLPTFGFENEVERKYFAQFQEKTALEIAPYFDSETWRRLVLQTCQVPAIRHAIIAIGALDKTYMTSRTENDSNLDLSEDADSPNVHRRIALNHYTKAIRSMRESVEHGKQDLRTTLITCLVIACFEAFHGNHPLANAQILTGMSLIYEWKATFSNEVPMGFKSPKPDIVEDDLVQTFGRLEFQTCEYVGMYNRPTATLERQAALRAAGTNVLRNMPREFESLQSARIYLELITRRLGDLWHICMGLFYPPDQKPVEGEANDANFNEVFMRKETAIAELRLWYSSFEPMMKRGHISETVGSLMLKMHFKAAVMTLETTLHTKFQDTPEMWDIVDLSRKILARVESGSTPKFALDVGIVIPLYLVGVKCSATSLRREVIELMHASPRREGLWDSVVAGSVVRWILDVEAVYEDRARGLIPNWARVNSVGMVVDIWDRSMRMWGYQQTSEEDRTMKKLETSVKF
ncbi:hypothetical protein BGZ57DRAFT_747773 [Hyaloscypha finlandica]|nr:hypothetical protein BGZ57DRAFT_747773 [Hyaloscypha finlandica]